MAKVLISGIKKSKWILLGAAVLAVFLVRTAWCAEDAFIAFRVVENFLRGQGLTWNVGERVQVFTDPLYELILIPVTWLVGNIYFSATALSLALSLAAYCLLMAQREALTILLGTVILLNAKGFMDFSVSGLENPATHLAIAAYVWVYWRKPDPFRLTLIASLAAVNRMDSLLLFLPSLAWIYYRTGRGIWKPALLGSAPFLAWEAFSIFYYGFPFPNTAYAKLNMGIAKLALAKQGIRYVQNAIAWDTVSMLTIAGGIGLGLMGEDRPLALGAILSLLYIVQVGGDYMSGRFLTPAFVLCCALVMQHAPRKRIKVFALSSAALVFGLLLLTPPLLTTKGILRGEQGKPDEYLGVADERLIWYAYTGLLNYDPGKPWPGHSWRAYGLKIRDSGNHFADLMPVGIIPYFAGPGVYVYDRGALGDALTARLQMVPGAAWRPGHYFREPPAGYLETLQSNVNQIKDPKLFEYYEHLRKIIRGDLWDPSRWREIVAMNLGSYDILLP